MIIDDLTRAKLVKRYKRFLADVELDSGEEITVHCPNPGSMKGCLVENSPVYIKDSKNPKRKLQYTWSLVKLDSTLVIVDTGFANKFVKGLVIEDEISELSGYRYVIGEPKFLNGRFDLLLSNDEGALDRKNYLARSGDCLVEIKSTTLKEGKVAMFPDAKTERGRKHLNNLLQAQKQGIRAVQFFMVNRQDTSSFTSAKEIDPDYAKTLEDVSTKGVEVLAYDIDISIEEHSSSGKIESNVTLGDRLPVKY